MIKNLFIIDGAAAGSKTDLIRFIKEECVRSKRAILIQKYSTRNERPNEETDLIHIDDTEFNEKLKQVKGDFLEYEYEKKSYGFYVSSIKEAFKESNNVFIIIRDVETVERLRVLLKEARIILVYVYTDEKVAREILKSEGNSDDEINERIKRIKPAWSDFLAQNQLYRKVILNTSPDRQHYKLLIRKLINHYNQTNHDFIEISETERYILSKELKGYKDRIMDRIEETEFEKNVFLMMKFRNNNMYLYTLIKDILKGHGYNCLRADDISVSEKPSNPFAVLYCCKYGIALFDEAEHNNAYSPNVAFELGMMYAQDKDFLILRNKSLPEVPFDISTHLYKNYTNNDDIKRIIEKWLNDISKNK